MKESKACDRYPELYIKYKQGKKPNIFYDDPATGQETNVDISDWTTEEIDNWFLSRDFKQVGEIPNEDEIKKQERKNRRERKKRDKSFFPKNKKKEEIEFGQPEDLPKKFDKNEVFEKLKKKGKGAFPGLNAPELLEKLKQKRTEKDEEDTQKWAADAKRRMDESLAKAREMQQELDNEAKNEPKQEPAQSEGSQPDAEQPIDTNTDKAEL